MKSSMNNRPGRLRASAAAMAATIPRRYNASLGAVRSPNALMAMLAATRRSSSRTRMPPKVSSMAVKYVYHYNPIS